MNREEIFARVDHTALKATTTWEAIQRLCQEAIAYKTASVCIPPAYLKRAREAFPGLNLCTVIGFPLGYSTTACKVFETRDAIQNGADEIDMVINIGWVKDQRWDEVLAEIKAIKASCQGRILKVIVETCLLTEAEKIKLCELVTESGADYIKTSTGFSTGGATRDDVALLRANLPETVKVKASGGVRTLEDAQAYLELGAERLGASALVGEVRKQS